MKTFKMITLLAAFSLIFLGASVADSGNFGTYGMDHEPYYNGGSQWGPMGPNYGPQQGPMGPNHGPQAGTQGPAPVPPVAPQGPAAGPQGPGYNHEAFMNMINQMPFQPISDAELAGMMRMREEEKLAHDVYLFLAHRWNDPAFANIAQAEQAHMEAMRALMSKYGVPNTLQEDVPGVFTNPYFQNLYHEFTARGAASREGAMEVAATIEDMNIHDLNVMMAQADNEDIRFVYQNLMAGSMTHMRTYSNLMGSMGHMYSPRYMSQDEYDRIMMGM